LRKNLEFQDLDRNTDGPRNRTITGRQFADIREITGR
jgi:hypothetical protein